MNTPYKYYAFISYCHLDEKWAKWLQNKLESYNLPTQIKHDNPNLKHGIRPIFRDQTDLELGVLYDNIKEELAVSKNLIVIASPESAKSEWVGKEINEYLNTHQAGDIIPFIVNGTPNSGDDDECFNQAIKDIKPEILGVNINEIGRQQALTKVVAKLLNVRFDVLWQRHLRREKRKKICYGLLVLLFALIGIFAWDCTRSRYEYYADYVDCYGIPKGVVALNEKQVHHRRRMYRFCYRRQLNLQHFRQWRLSEVDYVNSAGTVMEITNTEYKDRFSVQKLNFGQSGTLVSIEYCDTKGKTILRHDLSSRDDVPASIVDFKSAVEGRGEGFLGAQTTSMSVGLMEKSNQKSNIIRYAYQRDSNGYVVRKTYHANNAYDLRSSAVYDADGVAGIAYQRDSLGRVVEMRYIDADNNYCRTKKGIAGRRYEYDQYGNIFKATYFDINESPIINEEGWAICKEKSDRNGNTIESVFYGADGKQCLNIYSVAKYIFKHDENGNLTEQTTFDINGKICYHKEGFAIVRLKYDKRSNDVERAFYGNDGKPCIIKYGYSKVVRKFDDVGNEIEWAYYDIDNNLCYCKDGYARQTAKYDRQGNVIELTIYGTDGNLCYCKDGYAKKTLKYDEHGNEIESVYYDTDGNLCLCKKGFAKCISKYDERGNRTDLSFYGVDGIPCLINDGYAKCISKYDERGNRTELSFLGVDGNLCLINDGYARWVSKYDGRGNEIECSFWGSDGNPCLNNDGYAKWISKYDERGNEVERSYYGTDGKPCLNNDGIAKNTSKYDERGNEIEQSFYGTDGKMCINNNGFAKATIKFDERGNEIESSFYGADGKPCLINYGYSKMIFKYNERGNIIERSCYGIDGNLCLRNDGTAKTISKYDERGIEIETSFYGTDDTPCFNNQGLSTMQILYDRKSHIVYSIGLKKEKINNAYGFCSIKTLFDERHRVTEVSYEDSDDNPVMPLGYYKEKRYYNERSKVIKTETYDDKNSLLSSTCNTFRVTSVSGIALREKVEEGSIILKFNNWTIGDDFESLAELCNMKNIPRKYILLSPSGEIKTFEIERGGFGAIFYPQAIETDQAEEWKKQYNLLEM